MKRKRLVLTANQVRMLRHSLSSYSKKYTSHPSFDPDDIFTEDWFIDNILRNELSDENEKKYTFEEGDVALINKSLRVYLKEYNEHLLTAFNDQGSSQQFNELWDIQQDIYNLLAKFKFYVTR